MRFMLETKGGGGGVEVKTHVLPRAGESIVYAGAAYEVTHVAHPATDCMDIEVGIHIPRVYVRRL